MRHMADFSSESLDLQKKVKEEDDNIKPMKEFESPEKLYDELIASVRKYHPSIVCCNYFSGVRVG